MTPSGSGGRNNPSDAPLFCLMKGIFVMLKTLAKILVYLCLHLGGRGKKHKPARTLTPEEAYRKREARRKRKAQKRARRRNRK